MSSIRISQALLALACSALALTGTVVDHLGTPLEGVQVEFVVDGNSMLSGIDGSFTLLEQGATSALQRHAPFISAGSAISYNALGRQVPTDLHIVKYQRGMLGGAGPLMSKALRLLGVTVDTVRFSMAGIVTKDIPIDDYSADLGQVALDSVYGILLDSRDGQSYNTVVIGTQTWMAQNLNYKPASGSTYCYANDTTNCDVYGRIYDHATALSSCPAGWHLPDTTEWSVLESTAGGFSVAGSKLKASTGLWIDNTGTDDFGFSALPAGSYNGNFINLGGYTFWWTSTTAGSEAYYLGVYGNSDGMNHNHNPLWVGFSVRCLKDSAQVANSSSSSQASSSSQGSSSSIQASSSSGPCVNMDGTNTVTDCRDGQTYSTVAIGAQTWMAQNLNYQPASGNAWCYGNDTTFCDTYGRLYDWATSLTVCPNSWHLPSDAEWTVLETTLGMTDSAAALTGYRGADLGDQLKASTNLWHTDTGTDAYGFGVLPAGIYSQGAGYYEGLATYFWSSTENPGTSYAWDRDFQDFNSDVSRILNGKETGFSVRCIKN